MLNLANKDRIFSSMRFSKDSSFASMASSDAIVYASRSVILRSFFYCQGAMAGSFDLRLGWKVEARVVAIVGIVWEGGGVDDGYRGSNIATLMPDDKTPEGAL
ncbi:hypothetical protein GW17_00044724 [Ensete ventricosum]|nr:hypothetical protein GW17_00044724 [Ensete ventricosum]